jgi:hypothetical protein
LSSEKSNHDGLPIPSDELLIKIGIRISPRTVRRYMPPTPQRPADPRQRWMTFVRNHAKAIIACDFFLAVTARLQLIYVFFMMEVGTRKLLHFISRATRRPIGRYSSFGNVLRAMKDTDSSFMIATAFLKPPTNRPKRIAIASD